MNALSTDDFLNNDYLKLKFDGEYLDGKKWNGKIYQDSNFLLGELENGNLIKPSSGYDNNNFKEFLNKGIIENNMIKEFDDDNNMIYKGEYLNEKRNGKGKEFKDNLMIFEGEYKNGKRNGKGKEYYYGKIIFDGEYKNGKRNGKGKEYNNLGDIIFEGEYLYDHKWNGKHYDKEGNLQYELNNGNGKIKEYDYYNTLIFDGEYLNGNKWKGKIFEEDIDDKLRFEGEYLDGKLNGKGKEYKDNNLIFEGEYLNGNRWNGKGKEYNYQNQLVFEGEYLNGNRWKGKGKEFNYGYELRFEGEYLNGQWNGKGKEYENDELLFEGEYKNGVKWIGKGKEYEYKVSENICICNLNKKEVSRYLRYPRKRQVCQRGRGCRRGYSSVRYHNPENNMGYYDYYD